MLLNILTYVPPLQDLNAWAYQGFVIKSLVLGAQAPAVLKHWPVPNTVIQVLLALLTFVMTPITAAKVFACLYLACAGALTWLLSRTTDNSVDGLRFLLLVCLVILHSPYWAGEFNYQVGILTLAAYFYFDKGRNTATITRDAACAVFLFFCHALCLAFFAIYIAWRSLLRRQIVRGIASLAPAIALSIWYVLADPRSDYDPSSALTVEPILHGWVQKVVYQVYVATKIGPYQNLLFAKLNDFQRCTPAYVLGVIANIAFAGFMGLFFVSWLIQAVRKREIDPASLAAVTYVLVAIVNPARALGIGNAGERTLALIRDPDSKCANLFGLVQVFLDLGNSLARAAL